VSGSTPTDEIDTSGAVRTGPVGAGKRDPLAAAIQAATAALDALEVHFTEHPSVSVADAMRRRGASNYLREAVDAMYRMKTERDTP